MRKLINVLILVVLGACCAASAKAQALQSDQGQGKTSLAWEYSLRGKEWSPLVSQQVGTLTRVPWLSTIDVSLIGGVAGGTNGAPTFGGMLSKSFAIADQASILVGLTGRITQSAPPQLGGIVFGLSFNFRS